MQCVQRVLHVSLITMQALWAAYPMADPFFIQLLFIHLGIYSESTLLFFLVEAADLVKHTNNPCPQARSVFCPARPLGIMQALWAAYPVAATPSVIPYISEEISFKLTKLYSYIFPHFSR